MIRRIVLIFAILVVSASAFVAPTSRNAGELKKKERRKPWKWSISVEV
jgi:hypothetical protein